MICRDCPAAKRLTSQRIECIQYGMILLDIHECEREGWKEYEGTDSHRSEVQGKAKIYDIREKIAGAGAGVLPGSGE